MNDRKFNLVDEKWIHGLSLEGKAEAYSLEEILLNAEACRELANELPTLDAAILRLLLAVLQTVVYRYDENGEESLLEEPEDALERWKAIWDAGHFPKEPIRQYLTEWRERFWLFHPERPFYQVLEAAKGTECTAAKLNGAISESNNKLRLFSDRSGDSKSGLTYSEAARWLLYVNGFDDTAAKPKTKGLPSPGAGWLGKLGLIFAEGDNLFETLMLNLVLLDSQEECWEEPNPAWELETPHRAERTEITIPNNQAELLTLQSRRILLKRADDRVTGYTLLGGDFFSKENAYQETMTIWARIKGKGKAPDYVQPRRNIPGRQMWRDFSSIVLSDELNTKPGVSVWISRLQGKRLLSGKKFIRFRIASVQYGDKDFFINDVFGDHLEFGAAMLTELGRDCARAVQEEIAKCDEAARIVRLLAGNLNIAAGRSREDAKWDEIVNESAAYFYSEIDQPFREWLLGLDPETFTKEKESIKWRMQEYGLAVRIGEELAAQAGESAFIGRFYTDKNGVKYFCSVSSALGQFKSQIGKCLDIKNVRAVISKGGRSS